VAFTLPELLVVIGIIALLVTILTPTMSQTIHVARDRICREHLYRIGQVAHSSSISLTGGAPNSFGLPGSDSWVGPISVIDRAVLHCPEDPNGGVGVVTDDELDKYYILQQEPGGTTWAISNLGAAFGVGGGTLNDGQFWTNKKPTAHTGQHPCYCKTPVRQANQEIAGICGEAIVVITSSTGGQYSFQSVIGCNAGPGHGSSSEHYLMKGTCTNGADCLKQDTKIMRLGGAAYTMIDAPYAFNISSTSYGMNYKIDCPTTNTHVPSLMHSSSQVMIMDANSVQVKVGEAGWMVDFVFRRHFGRVNYVSTGGAVSSISKAQMTDEYTRLEDKGDTGGSLLGSQATPLAKDK
jgi:prepilin-type N-terminal cleavage/methylation domain-containing protein